MMNMVKIRNSKNFALVIFLSIFVIYSGLRIVAWKNNIFLEDHDSVAFLMDMKVFRALDLDGIINMSPDATLFYRVFGALCSFSGGSIEFGARLCSFLFSSLLFFVLIGIGRQIGKTVEIAVGLLILTFSPTFIGLSFAVLTEPAYIATVYLGFYIFWARYRNITIKQGALLGIVFGLTYLNRLEGILYLAIIPFLQGTHLAFSRDKRYPVKRYAAWCLVYITLFCVMAAPQILRVSNKMGMFSLDGREVWSLLLNQQDGKSYEEKIYGLDYSEGQINLTYLRNNRDAQKELKADLPIRGYLRNIGKQFNELYQEKLGILIGPLGFFFFAFGIAALFQRGFRFEIWLIFGFVASGLIAPLLHNVAIRHISVIAPILFLIEGMGIVYLSQFLIDKYNMRSSTLYILNTIFLTLLIGAQLVPLYIAVSGSPNRNFKNFYNTFTSYKEPASIIREISEKELKRIPNIVTRKIHIAYVTGGKVLQMPYTDYDGLVKYCSINKADFLALHFTSLVNHPFVSMFERKKSTPHFVLLFEGKDDKGNRLRLYRFIGNERGTTNNTRVSLDATYL